MSRISLEGKLLFATAIVGILTLILTASALIPTYQSYRSAQDNLRAVESFRKVLEAANRISAERGPSNDIMSIEPKSSPATEERLATFRKRSDQALAALKAPMHEEIDAAAAHALDDALASTKDQLDHARATVDRISATPLSDRRTEDIQTAIGEMISVVDVFQNVTNGQVTAFTTRHPELTAPFVTGRIISDLREYGGRVASQILGPIATHQPLQSSHLAASSQTMGKLLELRQLLQGQRIMNGSDPLAAPLMEEVDSVFFGAGLDMVRMMIDEGKQSGNYSMSSVELTRYYVPTLLPLEKLRLLFLDETVKAYRLQHQTAFYRLINIGVITLFAFAMLAMLARSVRVYLLKPLLTARRQIIALADGTGAKDLSATSNSPETHSLFEALTLLRTKLEERAQYEARLKKQAEHDGLTGICNRRALEGFGHMLSSSGEDACLLLIDIDHFKGINDTYGHLTGDAVLIEIAALLQASMGPSDIVARFGGEEFAVLVSHADLPAAMRFAEKLRELIQTHVIRHAEIDAELTITASIGVATGKRGPETWKQLIAAADEALYRAKRNGRNRTCVFGEETEQPLAADAMLMFRERGQRRA